MKENKDKLHRAIGEIDDALIEEAAEYKTVPRRALLRYAPLIAIFVIALLVMLPFALAEVLPVPISTTEQGALATPMTTVGDFSTAVDNPPTPAVTMQDLTPYQNSPYYEAIKSVFEKEYLDKVLDVRDPNDVADPDSPADIPTVSLDVVDHQVSGVREGDILMKNEQYIFLLSEKGELLVFCYDDSTLEMIKSTTPDVSVPGWSQKPIEMYLTDGGDTLIVIYSLLKQYEDARIQITAFDVSAPTEIKAINTVYLDGWYCSTRLTDGKLVVLGEATPYTTRDVPHVPYVNINGDKTVIMPDMLSSPAMPNSRASTIVYLINEKTLEVIDTHAVLGYSSVYYVGKDKIYIVTSSRMRDEIMGDPIVTDGYHTVNAVSSVTVLDYGDGGVTEKGSVTVKGRVLNQYSLDEKDGVLRIVTTTSLSRYHLAPEGDCYLTVSNAPSNASLYLVSLLDFSIIASVENFAPPGESVYSVRFEENRAYVCTAIEVTDPVFFFDLSDMNNITYAKTKDIDGYSTSLIEYPDGTLLGVGYENFSRMKLEAFQKTGGEVVSSDKLLMPEDEYFSSQYRSYYINRERGYFGIGTVEYESSNTVTNRYRLYQVKDGKIVEIARATFTPVKRGDHVASDYLRGFVLNDCLYVVGDSTVYAIVPLT